MAKKKPLLPEEEDDNRFKVNPFQEHDEKDGVDLDDPISRKNSFLDDEDDEDDEDEEIDPDLFDDDLL